MSKRYKRQDEEACTRQRLYNLGTKKNNNCNILKYIKYVYTKK